MPRQSDLAIERSLKRMVTQYLVKGVENMQNLFHMLQYKPHVGEKPGR